jgi:hypothetical protein
MYCLLALLTVVGVVVVLAMVLFVASAAVIVIDEGMRFALGLSAKYLRQILTFSTAKQKGWLLVITDQPCFAKST